MYKLSLLISFILALSALNVIVLARKGFGPGEQEYGHVTVRPGAHMFYWLYYTTATKDFTERPLAIWLQGGPGASSTAYGNFEELGPLDLDLNPRNHTWVKDMNVMFIDNPVGSGYSYVDNVKYLTTTNKQIALDLVELMKQFYEKYPAFKKVPLHIFSESYGGKMAPEFALELHDAIKRNEIESNLQSVLLGDPWVSPMDSVWSWAPFLLNTAMVDDQGYDKIMVAAQKVQNAIDAEEWTRATSLWGSAEMVIMQQAKNVDFYNILKRIEGYAVRSLNSLNENHLMYRTLVSRDLFEPLSRDARLTKLMRTEVATALNISSKIMFGAQSSQTFQTLSGDFMKPVIHIVNKLLNSTNINVGVFSGHLDLICATPGTVNWIKKLEWPQRKNYDAAPRKAISVNGIYEGYTKDIKGFAMFWINRAGHMVPNDNPAGMSYILRKYTKYG